jgi:DNA-binding response OmpR family regulator
LDSWTVGQESRSEKEKLSNCQLPTANLPANCTVISISDTGSGIAPDHLAHIFDRFYQADDSISREQEGTGIGLAIAQEMVRLHKGEIEVSSEVDVGTTFRIFLPMGDEHLMEEEKWRKGEEEIDNGSQFPVPGSQSELQPETWNLEPETLETETQTGNGERETGNGEPGTDQPILLIVEDNPDMRAFIRGYFDQEYQVMEGENGEEGLNLAIEQIPDIVVSDVMMPKMDGYAFCQKLKMDDRTCHVPVILLTARASKESRLEGLETGADDFITKPFDGEELQVRVKNLVDQRKKLSEHYQKRFEPISAESSDAILSRDEKFLNKAQSVVEVNLSNPEYGVDSFASDMALSRFQLHRKLKALLDQSVTEFIRTIRLNYAITLLQKRAGTISEIAYDAGFNNPTYFTISFKKKYGISPSEYMDQLGKK